MKKSQFFMLLISAMMAFAALAFTSCVDDNDDKGLPYLEVSPETLSFDEAGKAVAGSDIVIKTNRPWRVTFEKDVTWVRLSATEGKGSATLSVSVPEFNGGRQTKVSIATYNAYGDLITKTVTVSQGTVKPVELIFKETFGTTGASAQPYPTVADYTGWDKSGIGSSTVTYSGENAQLRNSSPSDNNFSGYPGSGGTNLYFSAAPNDFIVNDITIPEGTTAFTLTFGAYIFNPTSGDQYNNVYSVMMSADGVTWTSAVPFQMTFVAEKSWNLATINFQVKEYTSKLYLKFSASSGNNRIDDVILNTGNGGIVVDLAGGGVDPDPDAKVITIPDLNAQMTTTEAVIDANNDRFFEAVVMNDVAGGNYSFNNLILATEGSTAAGNGVTLYGSQVEPTVINVDKGDKVRVTLYKGLAKAVLYNGMYEVTGAKEATWCKVEKVGTATVSTATITADKLAEYQGMSVTIQNATTAAAGIWANADAISSHTFNVAGANFTVFCKKGATAFLDQPYKVATGSISGLAAVNSNKGQLVPRNLADVATFSSTDPTITAVDPTSLTFPAEGSTQTIAVTVANQGANTLSVSGLSGILSATVSGTTVTVKADPNTTGTAVEQTLTITLQNGNSKTVPVKVAAAGSGSDTQIVMDFLAGVTANPALPTSKQATPPPATVHAIGGYDWTFSPTEAYYVLNSNKLLIGKKDAFIGFPVVAGKKLTKVEFTTPAGSSGKVTVGVMTPAGAFVAGGENKTLAASQTFTYDLTGTDAAVSYRLTVTNDNNFQIEKLTLTYGDGGGSQPQTPEITAVNPTSLSFDAAGATKTIAVTVANQGSNALSVSGLSGTLSATVSGTTVTVVAAPNSGAAVNQTLTIAVAGGNSKTVPVSQSAQAPVGTTFTMTAADIIAGKTGTVAIVETTYGSQNVNDPATWYNWTSNSLNFTGVKLLIASAANGGGIQVQGNASTVTSQGRIANVSALNNIQSMQIVLKVVETVTFDPAYNVYAGTTANPTSADTKITGTSSVVTEGGFKVFTQTFDFSGGNYSYFNIMNDLAGALYIDSIKVTYKK